VASEAAAALAGLGVSCGVVNARYAKPLDLDLLSRTLRTAPRLVTVEEHLATGGFGSAVLEACEEHGFDSSRVRVHAIPDQFIDHSPQALQRKNFRLDAPGIVSRVLELFPDLASGSRLASDKREGGKGDEKLVETVSW